MNVILHDRRHPIVGTEKVGGLAVAVRALAPDLLAKLRFAELGDAMAPQRRQEIEAIFGHQDFHALSPWSLAGIAQAGQSYEILFVSADDFLRLRSALKPPANMLIKKKLSFIYSSKSDPRARAELFKFGFDDAFYSSMDGSEIIARMQAAYARLLVSQATGAEESSEEWDDFCSYHVIGRLERRQVTIVKALLEAKGAIVPIKNLASFDFVAHEYRGNSLKVSISQIRRKLVNCDIVAARGSGYRLVIH